MNAALGNMSTNLCYFHNMTWTYIIYHILMVTSKCSTWWHVHQVMRFSQQHLVHLYNTQSSTQNAHYRYPASTACSFSQIAWWAFGEEMVSFAWNKVKKRTFTVDIITTGIVVDFPVPKMPQNWQTKAYFDVFLFRWMKRTISSMKTNYYRDENG